jgi:predicted secreted protein
MQKLRVSFALILLLIPTLGQSDTEPLTYNRISFTEEAGTEVENDLLVAVMSVEREGSRSDLLAAEVNRIIESAVQKVKPVSEIKLQTLSYRTHAIYKKSEIRGWRVHQSMRLESRDSKLLGKVIADLQKTLNVQSINYQISDERRRQHTDRLIEQALERFQSRAAKITQALGKIGHRIVKISVNTGQPKTIPRYGQMRAKSMSIKDSSPVQIEAGTQRLNVTLDGEIELLD